MGTACGFAVNIGKALFILRRRTARIAPHARRADCAAPTREGRKQTAVFLKRFILRHRRIACGHAARGFRSAGARRQRKLGFRAHYRSSKPNSPRAAPTSMISPQTAPVEAEVRKRFGTSFWPRTTHAGGGCCPTGLPQRTLTIWNRLPATDRRAYCASAGGGESRARASLRANGRSVVAVGLQKCPPHHTRSAEAVARAAQQHTKATHALAVLIDLDAGADRIEFAGTGFCIATAGDVASRRTV